MHPRRRARGFTLVELLIAVAIIALLSAMAIAGYIKYVHAAQSAEARVMFGQIRNGEEAYRAETLGYLSCSSSMTDYYPNSTPNDSRWAWRRPSDARYSSTTNGWAMLNVNPDGPVRYGYAVMAGVAPAPLPAADPSFVHPPQWPTNMTAGTPWYVIGAKDAHYGSGLPSLLVTTSYDGTIYSENDDR